ncbi:MAG: DUF3108 domain-containing protein [Gallionella sp.]|nr:DUF3108 domain-containing protein [Gallionella sp.]MDD4945591.1 DUF3108 domain-containing protein [Gallionella sp.]MDD5612882.1 DUF3108 domain-containing protein [Gallionella sp.]
MNLLPETARGRIALAIGLSLLLHTALMFGPKLVELPPVEPTLPPLQAKLEPLPKIQPVTPKPPPKHHPGKPQHTPTQPPEAAPIALAGPEPGVPPSAPSPPSPEPPPVDVQAATTPAAEPPPHPLPRQAQLTFSVYKGQDLTVGEARQKLEISDNGHYTLQVSMQTIGLARLFKTFVMEQHSSGTLDASGLRPETYNEGKVNDDNSQTLTAHFDWPNRLLSFSSGNQTALPDQAQDMLSFLYQLSQSPLDQPVLTMYISNGKKLEKYQLEVGQEGSVLTRNGKLRALPLRKIHAPGEEGLEVWLGLEYRLLPVKIVQIDRNGDVAGQMVVTDIRVSPD